MKYRTLFFANLKRHKGGLAGVFALVAIISLTLAAVLSVWVNSQEYVRREMERVGFGSLTAWTSGPAAPEALEREIASLPDVAGVSVQPLIFSEYAINGQESDSEGQLIAYDPERYPYRIFTEDLSGFQEGPAEIGPGEIYVSPSLHSMFGARIGDEIRFPIARAGVERTFVITGYFEDPFMGSSMIGMKSFLIREQDRAETAQAVQEAGIDALARAGAMLHIYQQADSPYSTAEWNRMINESSRLPEYTEFAHSSAAIAGFMLILQNTFSGFLLAFAAVLLAVAMLVLGHSISSAIERDTANMGILKAMGFTSGMLRRLQLLLYLSAILCGMVCGALASLGIVPLIDRMTVTTTGLLIPGNLPAGLCALSFAAVLGLLAGFICLKTRKIGQIVPMRAIRGSGDANPVKAGSLPPIHAKRLGLWMALRQLSTEKKQVASAFAVAVLLVFFASLIGRMNAWLGPDGKGLMDAFNPADHDLGVQFFGELDQEEVEGAITRYTPITDRYLLAMPGLAVNGVDYTANVITEPERFHILRGRTCANPDEIVLTEFAAADLGVGPGDTLTVSGGNNSEEYIISGIYQCANDLGANIGISREGYYRIGEDVPSMWCFHYFLEDPSKKADIMQVLSDTYGGDIHVHENAWPGLYGIIGAMQALMAVMYGVVVAFVLIVVTLTGSKILSMEQRDLGIYKALGCSARRLRGSFSLRFGIVALAGSCLGVLFSAVLTDPLVASLMRLCGISNFASRPGLESVLLPAVVVTGTFAGFAYLASRKIQIVELPSLITEC